MRKKIAFQIVVFMLFLGITNISISAEEICQHYDDPNCSPEEAFENNPTYQNFDQIENPEISQFQKLTPYYQQMYLVTNSNTEAEFAVEYLIGNFKGEDIRDVSIAENLFAKGAEHVNEIPQVFMKYLQAEGVSVNLLGKVEGYSKDGTISASNGKINVKKLAKTYDFEITPRGEIVLITKSADDVATVAQQQRHTFDGTITTTSQGRIQILGGGAFDGLETKNVYSLWIDANGKIHATAEKFGDLSFEGRANVIYDPQENQRGAKYTLYEAQLKGSNYELTGTIYVDEDEEYHVAAGDKLMIQPYKNEGHLRLGNEKYTLAALTDDVELDLDYGQLDSIKSFLVSKWGEGENKVGFTSESTPVLTSVEKSEEESADYRVGFDTSAVVAAGSKDGVPEKIMKLHARGYYQAGDKAQEGTSEHETIKVIQQIIGITPDGSYGKITKTAVAKWQEAYNQRMGLAPGNEGYLKPDGLWGRSALEAYYKSAPQESYVQEVVIEPRGGRIVVSNQEIGIGIDLKGNADVELKGVRFRYQDGKMDKEALAKSIIEDVKTPMSITGYNQDGDDVLTLKSFRDKYVVTSLGERIASGEIAIACTISKSVDTSKANCATFVSELAKLEGGGRALTYGQGESFAAYTGQFGNAWGMSRNIRTHGGETIWWKGQEQDVSSPASKLAYDFSSFKEGDVVGFYYTGSHYLDAAKADGVDGRVNTHVGKIVGVNREVYIAEQSTDLKTFIEKQRGVKDPSVLGSVEVWVENSQTKLHEQAHLANDGLFYLENQLEGKTPKADAVPITIKTGSSVVVGIPIVSHLYAKGNEAPIRTEPLDKFLDKNPKFSLYEHMRPNPDRYTEAAEKLSTLVPTTLEGETLEEHFRAQGIPEDQIKELIWITEQQNSADAESMGKGDVIYIPQVNSVQKDIIITDAQVPEQFSQLGIKNSEKIIETVYNSAAERAREYKIPIKEADELAKVTFAIGFQESYWGQPHGKYRAKFLLEQTGAWLSGFLPEKFAKEQLMETSIGYLQLNSEHAQREAEYLGTNDYQGPKELATLEGGVKHSQRHLAAIWKEYTVPEMTFDEKLERVAAVYHYGEDYPITAAVQQQLKDVTGKQIVVDGYLIDKNTGTGETLVGLQEYAEERGIPFDSQQVIEDIRSTAVYAALREDWKKQHENQEPFDLFLPSHEPPRRTYITAVKEYCQRMGAECEPVLV